MDGVAPQSGDDQETQILDNAVLEGLAGQICASAAQQAQASCRLLELIGEFDAGGGLDYLRNAKSMAHWVSWSCSMAPGAAREHVRVARAMRQMPTVTAAFRDGALSYSKVREATRVVGLVDEERLCALARAATASQLARTISGFRTASGTRIGQQERRRFGLVHAGDDQMTGLSGRLPVEEAGVLSAALRAARDLNAPVPSTTRSEQDPGQNVQPSAAQGTGSATPPYNDVDALLDICRHYLATAENEDESGEDRNLVVVDVAAEQLAAEPAGSQRGTDETLIDMCGENVSAGTRDDVSAGTSGTVDDAVDRMSDAGAAAPEWMAERSEHVPAGTPGGDSCDGCGDLFRVDETEAWTDAVSDRTDSADGAAGANDIDVGGARGDGKFGGDGDIGGGAATSVQVSDVRAGTSGRFRSWVCSVRGVGGVEPATADRMICTGTLLGAVVDAHGDVLALGRSRRLVSKTQRRALMVRDRMCQFPGCAQHRHLEAHHVTPWSQGGRTDLDQLVLLCRFHHLAVHEGGITISRRREVQRTITHPPAVIDPSNTAETRGDAAPPRTDGSVWEFTLPGGEALAADGDRVPTSDQLLSQLTRSQTSEVRQIRGMSDPRARVILSDQTGERFDLHEAVQALFRMMPPATEQAA